MGPVPTSGHDSVTRSQASTVRLVLEPPAWADDTAQERKARGAFFTPQEICTFLAAWAIRSASDRVMEPACGEAAFLEAATGRLTALGAPLPATGLRAFGQVQGVELHEASAHHAAMVVTRAGIPSTIFEGDFFDLDPPRNPEGGFDAVIGNPPYVRYQDFAGAARLKGQRRALEAGRPVSGLASSWAPFVLHASRFLAPGGRLGLVLPAELLGVNYAAPVRSFLLETFASVELVMFDERVFPGVMEEVVLLLAEGPGGSTDHFRVRQLRSLAELDGVAISSSWAPIRSGEKWLPALLPTTAAEVYAELASGGFGPLRTWGSTYLGSVTGNNRWFTLTAQEAYALGLGNNDLVPISPPGSRHLRGVTFTQRAWQDMQAAGARVHLFYPHGEPSPAALAYIASGSAEGVQGAYKCRVRSPWWRVPRVPVPDLLLTYMNHDTPRVVTNRAGVSHINSVHGVKLTADRMEAGTDLLPIAALNSMTVLGAELVGRAYGGGMLKVEPKEADLLPVPSHELVVEAGPALRAIAPQLGEALRGGSLDAAVELVDRVILIDGAGLRRASVKELREARAALFARRLARS
jgi:adenine-specific DNA-methyltransferase